MNWHRPLWWLLIVISLVACDSREQATPTPTTMAEVETAASPTPSVREATNTPEAADPTTPPEPSPTATLVELMVTATPPAAPTWPEAIPLPEPFTHNELTAAEQATFDELTASQPPERDDVALAVAYRGIGDFVHATPQPPETLEVGARETLNILNHDDNTVSQIEAELLAVGEHAYFWFDTGPGSFEPDPELVAFARDAFDEIYEADVAIFGSEDNPGLDNDPRVHIVNASPLALCNVSLSTAGQCGLAGYFGSSDVLPAEVDPNSNEREMFVMNMYYFGDDFYLDVLAHEFRHMIEDNYDKNDLDWEVEGSAMLAEDLLGFTESPLARANLFLDNPDQQLNRWTDGNSIPYYGQGYLFNRYIYDRLGAEGYSQFAVSPENGLQAIDAVAAANNLAFNGEQIWLDWLAALAIHNQPGRAKEYQIGIEGLDTAAMSRISAPYDQETTVHQYAADYYQLSGSGEVTIDFTGSAFVPVAGIAPASGEFMWYANRANYSNLRLTHEFDLSEVTEATLEYSVYHDIEHGYDFAYVSVSTDGGQTWQGLEASHMQGLAGEDDPSDSAYTERFYTGHGQGWEEETADLTPYAGQVIQIRFEYVTDPILTFGGLLVDNIAIPEIGFYDDVEAGAGDWLAEGFSRVTAVMPQRWHLILITIENGVPVVQTPVVTAGETLSLPLNLSDFDDSPILIVAASAPLTLEEAHYRLEIE
jgi:immune inhibitor A